ncbi:hypothetical protein KUV57_09315 [Epibacterium sp. DP7N7-1]|nr:hypothetical protein [Epibacterium sp. DP7N7-1]
MEQKIADLLEDFFALEGRAFNPGDINSPDGYMTSYFNDFCRYFGYLPDSSRRINGPSISVQFDGDPEEVMFAITRQFRIFSGYFHQWRAMKELDSEDTESGIHLSQELRLSLHDKISEARELVILSAWMPPEQKDRVLKALIGVDRQLDKELGNYHTMLGMVEDVFETVGKSSEKAQPIVGLLTGIRNAITGERNKPLEIGQDRRPKQITDQSNSS